MSILGAVLRTHPDRLAKVLGRLTGIPGVDIALNPGDGRVVLVMEDVEFNGALHSAATALADMAMWPDVLSTSLVYEYSGPDAPALGEGDMSDYRAWRGKPGRHAVNHGAPIAAAVLPSGHELPAAAFSTRLESVHPVPACTDKENLP